jgi:hypothetical protein
MANPDTIKASILAHASENSLLLVKLSSTSENPSNFQIHTTKISRLQDELSTQEAELQKITEDIEVKFKKHQSLRDSTLRRLLHRATLMGAKFEAKARKEEQDYFAALSMQSKATKRLPHLKQTIDEALAALGPLEAGAKEHDDTHARIDKLYEKLFAGPTPGFPVEDGLESQCYASREINEAMIAKIRGARRSLRLLQRAVVQLKKARACLETAQQATDNSIVFFGESIAWLKECSEHIVYALTAVDQSRANQSPVPTAVGAVEVKVLELLIAANNSLAASVSRAIIVSTIQVSQANITAAEEKLAELIGLIKTKELDGLQQIKLTARELENGRQALQQNRQGIFEQVAGFGEAAPSYKECCDRAEEYCSVPTEEDEPEEDERGTILEGKDNKLDKEMVPSYSVEGPSSERNLSRPDY